MDIKPDDLRRMKPQIDAQAARIRAKDTALHGRLAEYDAAVVPSSEKAHALYSLLWNGEDRVTKEPLADEQVIPTMHAYLDAAIEHAQIKIQNPWDGEDFHQASQELAQLTQIKEQGMDGLFTFCQQTLDFIPKRQDTGQIDASWMPLIQRWQHYQELIRAAK